MTSDAALNRRNAEPFKINGAGFLMVADRYRERVDVEIGKASERGARWWSLLARIASSVYAVD